MRLSQRLVIKYIRTKFKILSAISKRKAAEKAFQLFCTPQYRNKKRLPRIFETAEKISFAFEGCRIQGYRWNHPSDRKALIVHGFESSVINFDRYVRPLIKSGYEVLAFDAPAHGRSTGKKINAMIYKNFILHINKIYGPINSFMAHSLGGLALSLALEEMKITPEHKIVFIAPATETTTAINSFFNFLQLDGDVRKEFDKIIEQFSGHPPKWFSIARVAPNINARVLWFHDKDDTMTPLKDVQPIIEKHHQNIEFIITEGLGHRRIYRENKVSRKIIEFFTIGQAHT